MLGQDHLSATQAPVRGAVTRPLALALLVFLCAALTGHAAFGWIGKNKKNLQEASPQSPPPVFDPRDMPALFDARCFYQKAFAPVFTKSLSSGHVTVHTTIEPRLQEHLQTLFQKYSPLIAAGVVLDAGTGAVLAMANYTRGSAGRDLLPDGEENYCLYAGFPAASLIKIITAAAALETGGFAPDRTIPVSGGYHTLHRSQLDLVQARRHAEQVPLEKAFALSINPFFGKLLIHHLSDSDFLKTADGFLFNAPLAFDLPVQQSTLVPPTTDFERAEVASGYNTRTRVSPLHAAMIASLAANEGAIMRPYLVDRVVDAAGNEIYHKTVTCLSRPLGSMSVQQLRILMQGTVRTGTARSSFAGLLARPDAKDWITGGKTGSIDLPEHRGRCDWFAGFGQNGGTRVAVACILIHGANRTVRSSYVASQAVLACLAETAPAVAAAQPARAFRKHAAHKETGPALRTSQGAGKQAGRAKHRAATKKKRALPVETAAGG